MMPDAGQYAPVKLRGRVTFDHVYFAYTDERWVLKNISFRN